MRIVIMTDASTEAGVLNPFVSPKFTGESKSGNGLFRGFVALGVRVSPIVRRNPWCIKFRIYIGTPNVENVPTAAVELRQRGYVEFKFSAVSRFAPIGG